MLLVAIHDVAPPQQPAVEALWARCRARGIVPALLVVPDWHGVAPLERHPAFVAWLRRAADEGAEIVLHGERHDEVGRRRTPADAWRALNRTAREGECLSLEADELRALVARGAERLRALGLEPAGFIPPAWLMRPHAERAVGEAGLGFTEDDRRIWLYPGAQVLRSPVVRWSARSAMRAHGSVGVAALRWTLQRGARYPRLALHPGDLAHPAVTASLDRALRQWPAAHPVGRYADLVA